MAETLMAYSGAGFLALAMAISGFKIFKDIKKVIKIAKEKRMRNSIVVYRFEE